MAIYYLRFRLSQCRVATAGNCTDTLAAVCESVRAYTSDAHDPLSALYACTSMYGRSQFSLYNRLGAKRVIVFSQTLAKITLEIYAVLFINIIIIIIARYYTYINIQVQ